MMIAAEAAPYVKVGGLADVVGALSRDLARLGCQVELVLPGYLSIAKQQLGFEFVGAIDVPYCGRSARVDLHRLRPEEGLCITVIDEPAAFDREGIYDDPKTGEGYRDNPERFAFFARAAAEMVVRDPPHLVHVHDSHGALVPGLLKDVLAWRLQKPVATVLTIHNLAYQMHCRPEILFDIGFPRELFFPMSPLEFHGGANFLKTGIHYADAITTVSDRYAQEIQTEQMGCGLSGLLQARSGDLLGVLNGIDTAEWDPSRDPLIPAHYSVNDLRGKRACREELLRASGLSASPNTPIVGMVGRLADQKGLDLFLGAADWLVRQDLRFTILGSGQEKYHQLLSALRERHPDKVALYLGFNNELAHRIEAGSDYFLMPSRFEPCGLNQMYSMRYGSIPIVRRTGGLADTVTDVDQHRESGTGFVFDEPSSEALAGKMHSAMNLNQNGAQKLAVIRRGMSQDFSAQRAARKYLDLYASLVRRDPAKA